MTGGEARVGVRVADDLRGAPGLLAVGEAALELLEPVAAGDAAAEVERQPELGAESSIRAATTFFIGESRRCESALPLR